MSSKRIPEEVKQQVDEIVKKFNQTVLKDPNYYYATRYRVNYLYLDRFDYGRVGPICRWHDRRGNESWS
jgi:hypothetical protein